MRNAHIAYIGFLLVAFLGAAAYASAALEDNLIAYYANEDNATYLDELGNFDGTIHPNGIGLDTSGALGNATFYNSITNVNIGNVHGTGDFSISLWLKTTDTSPDLLAQTTLSGDYFYFFKNNSATDGQGDLCDIRASINDGGGEVYECAEVAALNDDNWHHVVTAYSDVSDNISLYYDGVYHGTTNTSGTFSSPNNWYIGALTSQYYGSLDEIAFFNRTLTQDDVDNLYGGGTPPYYDNTTGLFDLPTGDNCTDADNLTKCYCNENLTAFEIDGADNFCYVDEDHNLTLGGGDYYINGTIIVESAYLNANVLFDGNGSTVYMKDNRQFLINNPTNNNAYRNNLRIKNLTYRSNQSFDATEPHIQSYQYNTYLDDVDLLVRSDNNDFTIYMSSGNLHINNSNIVTTKGKSIDNNANLYLYDSTINGTRDRFIDVTNYWIYDSILHHTAESGVGSEALYSTSGRGEIYNTVLGDDGIVLNNLANIVTIDNVTGLSKYEVQNPNNRLVTITNTDITLVLSLTNLENHVFINNTIGTLRPRGTLERMDWYYGSGMTNTVFDFDDASFGSSPRDLQFYYEDDVRVDYDIGGRLYNNDLNDTFQMGPDWVWAEPGTLFDTNATITFNGVDPTDKPLRDGVFCGLTNCTDWSNNGTVMVINVTGWSNYTYGYVNNPPNLTGFSPATPATVLTNETFNFSISYTDPDNDTLSHQWYKDSNPLGGETDAWTIITGSYATIGNYNYTVFAWDNDYNLSQEWDVTISIHAIPEIALTPTPATSSQTIDEDEFLNLSVVATDDANSSYTYSWSVDGGPIAESDNDYEVNASALGTGVHPIMVTVTSVYDTASFTWNVAILPLESGEVEEAPPIPTTGTILDTIWQNLSVYVFGSGAIAGLWILLLIFGIGALMRIPMSFLILMIVPATLTFMALGYLPMLVGGIILFLIALVFAFSFWQNK